MFDLTAVLSTAYKKKEKKQKQLLQSIDKKFEKRVYGTSYIESRLSEIGEFMYESPQGCEKMYLLPHNSAAILPLMINVVILMSDCSENMEELVAKIGKSYLSPRYGCDFKYNRHAVDESGEVIEKLW